jgi:quercetin dioxygenase-like cupin family protein
MTTPLAVLHHPGTGETIRVLESTDDVFRMELTIAPRGEVAAAHLHPYQEQTFEVLAGKLAVTTHGGARILEANDKLVLAPGAGHSQGNPFDEPVVAIETYRPARRMHEFFEVFFAMGAKGMTNTKGVPSLMYVVAIFDEFSQSIRPGRLVDRVVVRLLAPLARVLGYRRRLRAIRSTNALESSGYASARKRAPGGPSAGGTDGVLHVRSQS